MTEKDLLSNLIDKLFEIKKGTLLLILTLLFGFILRLIAAINLRVSADDMHFVTHAINFLSSGKLITWGMSAGLWHAFTDISYQLFGVTQIGSRMAALIFGSLSILAIYLLSREFFNEKISLIAAFFLAIAPFHIKLTIAEQDVMAMFFVLTGMILFIKGLKSNKSRFFVFSGTFIGLAIYTKVYPLLFIPSLILYGIYFKKKSDGKVINKNNARMLLIFLIFAFIFTIPALTHNYLLYNDKGFLDLQFTRTFGLGKNISEQYYGWDHQFDAKNDWRGLVFGNSSNSGSSVPTLWQAINYIRIGSPLIFYLGIIGILLMLFYKKKNLFNKDYLVFFVVSTIFALPFLASIILLPKHYVFLELLLTPICAIIVNEANMKFFRSREKEMKIILIVILLTSLIFLGFTNTNTHFYGKSAVAQTIEFKEKTIPENSLVIGDSRIYRGQIHWMLHGRPYLEGTDFIQIINSQDNLPGEFSNVKVFFLECVNDDCGWGAIKDQPEFNESMEKLVEFFKVQGTLEKTISEPDESKSYYPIISSSKKVETFKVYSITLPLKKIVVEVASEPKNWFLYDIGYEPKKKQFDYYDTNGLGTILNMLAHWILLFSTILTFLSPLFVIFLLLKNEKNNNNNTHIQRRENLGENP